MFLSRLKIIGFKSFPDKTILDFTDGITSIVGPNGCGKTNIVDAIRWVLGEQKASILRSNKMEEVIFNGTQKKKPLGFCEATLTIENNKNLLPLEYDVVEIKRRYYRSGDSEYYINKTPCRLKDIHDMFIDTGMSSGAYSVIELKMIESILSQNPTDRRSMIDEAAGINNYNKQKNSSNRRLIATKSDMDRIFDIMSEVEGSVKKLKLQMKRFDRHKVLTNELIAAEHIYHKRSIEKLDNKISPLQSSLDQKEQHNESFSENLRIKEKDLENIQKNFEDTRLELESIQKKIKNIENSIINKNRDIIVSTEKIGNSKSKIEHFSNEIIVKKNQLESIQKDIVDIKNKLKKVNPEFSRVKSKHDEILSTNNKLENELYKLNNENKDSNLKINDLSSGINIDKNIIDSNNRLINEKNNLIKTFEKDIHLNSKVDNDTNNELNDLLKELKVSEKVKNKQDSLLIKLNKENDILTNNLIDKIKKSEEFKANIKELSNRIDFYNKVLISKEGLTSGNEFLFKNISKYKGVIGRVSDTFSASDSYLQSISIALGEYSDYIVVDKLHNALDILKVLDKKKMSFNIIVLEKINKSNILVTSSHLISKIKYSEKFENLLCLLIGDFILVDSLDAKMNKLNNYITLSGDMITKTGTMKINSNMHESKMSVNIEILNLEKKIKKIKKILIVNNEKEINAINSRQQKLKIKIEENIAKKEALYTLVNDLKIDIEQKKFINLENHNQIRSIKLNISKLEKEILDFKFKNKNLSNSLKQKTKMMLELDIKNRRLSKTIEKLNNELISSKQIIQEKNIDLITISNNRNSLLDRISNQTGNGDNIKTDIIRYNHEIKELNDLVKDLNISKNKYELDLREFHINEKKLNKVKDKLNHKYSSEYKQFQVYQSDIKDKRSIKESSASEINNIIVEIEKMKSEKDFLISALKEIDVSAINDSEFEKIEKLSLDDISNIIEKNNRSIDKIGPVNMEVTEQHEAEIERYQFLEEQYDDLVKSKESLEETIMKLDTEARKRFEETFEKIKINFSKTYNMFYEKGRASLDLKGEDVLDAEIIIKATPPGKSTQSLRMLSGGEKAITAISLLFAIYLVKPSPFCILDEVDAPLDDLNIKRFNSVIKEFSKNSQFIIVTHNKLTMEGSDYLYGVTQAKKGISKIVSVNLKDVEKDINLIV